jgi:Plavaka transposase
LKKVDQLLTSPEWNCDRVTLAGDQIGEDGSIMMDELEFWWHDPIECIRELIGNPNFKDSMAYEPVRMYQDEGGMDRIYCEAWTVMTSDN